MRQIIFGSRRNGRIEVSKINTNVAHIVIPYIIKYVNLIDSLSESMKSTYKERISILIDTAHVN